MINRTSESKSVIILKCFKHSLKIKERGFNYYKELKKSKMDEEKRKFADGGAVVATIAVVQ